MGHGALLNILPTWDQTRITASNIPEPATPALIQRQSSSRCICEYSLRSATPLLHHHETAKSETAPKQARARDATCIFRAAERRAGLLVTSELEKARAGCKAQVERIAKDCGAKNRRFRRLFGLSKENREYRPSDVQRVTKNFSNPSFFVDGADSNDVGIYGFLFFGDTACQWVPVIIDELSPPARQFAVHLDPQVQELTAAEKELYHRDKKFYNSSARKGGKSLYFARSGTEDETWLPLIERAYAKLHGDYTAIDGGFSCEAIVTLDTANTPQDILDPDVFWREELLLLATKDRLFGYGFDTLDSTRSGIQDLIVNGLIGVHCVQLSIGARASWFCATRGGLGVARREGVDGGVASRAQGTKTFVWERQATSAMQELRSYLTRNSASTPKLSRNSDPSSNSTLAPKLKYSPQITPRSRNFAPTLNPIVLGQTFIAMILELTDFFSRPPLRRNSAPTSNFCLNAEILIHHQRSTFNFARKFTTFYAYVWRPNLWLKIKFDSRAIFSPHYGQCSAQIQTFLKFLSDIKAANYFHVQALHSDWHSIIHSTEDSRTSLQVLHRPKTMLRRNTQPSRGRLVTSSSVLIALINHKFFRGRQIEFEPWKLNYAGDRRNSPSISLLGRPEQQQHSLGPFMVSLDKELQGWWLTTVPSTRHGTCVDPEYQRKGTGRLVNTIADKAAPTKTALCVECTTETNIEVYTKMGFHLMPKDNSGPDSCKGMYTGVKGQCPHVGPRHGLKRELRLPFAC
ncbi:hypothetical protein B0H16DRAFT_1461726 [Mycena metata]|uniref:N-acetyltransferase domain-containing protein n=1 Tax=Mycena metata TaxID=1033252 RepID=A0AAD7IQE3_9AGAR|nr:hypothetical protein B0H16DRAFT_1461726 [Mycena metata]